MKRPEKKNSYLQNGWLAQEMFKDWLAEVLEDTNAKFKLRKKEMFKLSHMAPDGLKSHADSEHHKQEIKIFQAIRSFFDKQGMKSASAKSDSTEETSQPSSSGSSSASSSTMTLSIGDKSTTSLSANKVLSQS